MVRPTFGGGIVVILPKPTRVSKAWPTTHAKNVIANNRWRTRLRFPLGSSDWASNWATTPVTSSVESGTNEGRAADPSAMARGFRLSTELVTGVVVGAALGWVLDRWLGISPWGMIVFLLLGFAAGVLNVMRAAGVAPSGPLDPKQ